MPRLSMVAVPSRCIVFADGKEDLNARNNLELRDQADMVHAWMVQEMPNAFNERMRELFLKDLIDEHPEIGDYIKFAKPELVRC